MAVQFEYDLSEAKKLFDKLSPSQLRKRAGAAMGEALSYLQTEVKKDTPVGVGVGGHLANSYEVTIHRGGRPVDMRGRLVSPLPHAIVIERGRRPGRKPPTGPIALWARLVLGLSDKEARSAAHAIAINISRRGFSERGRIGRGGARILEKTAKKAKRTVPRIFVKHFSGRWRI